MRTHEENSGFGLIETLMVLGLLGIILLGVRQLLDGAQKTAARDTLRAAHVELSRDLTLIINHLYRRHSTHNLTGSHRLTMNMPSGQVVIETVCLKNELSWQAPEDLLKRCMTCKKSERQVIRIKDLVKTRFFPAENQRPDLPAAASICFKNGADPGEVEMIVETLVVDPVNRSEKKVSKFQGFLVKGNNKITSFE